MTHTTKVLTRHGITLVTVLILLQPSIASAQPSERPSTQPSAADGERGVDRGSGVLRDIAGDFEQFFTSADTYILLGAGLGMSAGLQPLDNGIAGSWFNGEAVPSGALDTTFEVGEIIGGTAVQLGGALASLGVGRLLGRPDVVSLGRDVVRAQVLSGVMTHLLKYSVGRRRPDGASRRSFPSGHTSVTFASATVLQSHYGWKVGAPALGIAAYVAASRLSENRHYLSDVVFGAALGIAAARAVTFTLRDTRFDVTPMATPTGVGVHVNVPGF